ncbi:hypothetical protein [Streptomyces sp. NPDC127114]|uniref:hypothetical protein n=1 Tax=Streptomyces sp. NPDC127114 TaxID=3345366 RepID=UPI0036371467
MTARPAAEVDGAPLGADDPVVLAVMERLRELQAGTEPYSQVKVGKELAYMDVLGMRLGARFPGDAVLGLAAWLTEKGWAGSPPAEGESVRYGVRHANGPTPVACRYCGTAVQDPQARYVWAHVGDGASAPVCRICQPERVPSLMLAVLTSVVAVDERRILHQQVMAGDYVAVDLRAVDALAQEYRLRHDVAVELWATVLLREAERQLHTSQVAAHGLLAPAGVDGDGRRSAA